MTAPDVAAVDAASVESFAARLFDAGLAGVEMVNIALGARLRLYDALADGAATTPAALAARAGIAERYAGEWLAQQAAAEIVAVEDVDVDDDERRYTLPAAHAHVLLAQDSEAYMTPFADAVVAAATWLPLVEPAYRSGRGVAYSDYAVHDIQAAFTRPVFKHHLVQHWLPALPDVYAKLTAGHARVAEIGCGEGLAAITLAAAFAGVTVDGFDLDEASVTAARKHAADAGVADRVRFEVRDGAQLEADGAYDLVMCIEMLHDVSDPIGILAAMRRLRAAQGCVLVIDERVAERFTLPADPIERLLYAFSTLHCLPAGLAEQPSAATGTVMRPATVRRYAKAAGFASVEEPPVDHPQFRLYRLDG